MFKLITNKNSGSYDSFMIVNKTTGRLFKEYFNIITAKKELTILNEYL